MTTLVEKVLALSDSLTAAGVPHAFGGAIALAYCTEDPRGTRDVDVNAFVPATEPETLLAALPAGVAVPPGTAEVIVSQGQVRLWWDDTPVDLFLDYAPLDWVDIATAVEAGAVPLEQARRDLVALVGADDPRVCRWDEVVRVPG